MQDPKFFEECFLCKRSFQFGPHRYAGRRIPQWNIMICEGCDNGNWDGIVPSRSPQLIAHLHTLGVEIRLNEKGWIDLPRRGSA